MTAIGKKFTARQSGFDLGGVLFLAAGFGTRAEPLSHFRPKSLLPYGGKTVLGKLARQFSTLTPTSIAINASRCPHLLLHELEVGWPGCEGSLFFEERPLGAVGTISGLADRMSGGTWFVVNTDMVIPEFDPGTLLEFHRSTGASWTALTGEFPSEGEYSPLMVDQGRFGSGAGTGTHYWGVSVLEPVIPQLCRELQLSCGMFTTLAGEASRRGMELRCGTCTGDWLDFGRIDMLRTNILSGGSFIHPGACIASGARILGGHNIGAGCILADGTTVRDGVMLAGSALESGSLEESILPWFCSSSDGSAI